MRFILVLLFCISSHAQEVIELKGEILNDTITKSSVNVVNISMKKGTVSNTLGGFVVPVRVNDTIHISAVQYEPRQFVVSNTIYNKGSISLYLTPKVTELDEVVISSIALTGNIKNDVINTPLKRVITAIDLGLPQNAHPTFTPEERRLYSATVGAGPLGSLINAIRGRTKMLKRHLEIFKLQAKINATKDNFSKEFYLKELNLPGELIEDFLYYVFEDKEIIAQISNENSLELLDFLKAKSKVYLKLKEQEKQ